MIRNDGNPAHAHTHMHMHGQDYEHVHEHDRKRSVVGTQSADREKTLLEYMVTHNREHNEELEECRQRLLALGKNDAASILQDAIETFNAGNHKLATVLDVLGQE